MGFILELLGPLIVLSIPLAVCIFGWKYYLELRLEREFEELRFSNPKLYRNIVHEVCTHSTHYSQELVDQLGPKILAE